MPDPVDVYIGEQIRKRRVSMCKSQTAVAKACGLSFQQIQKYETGANRVAPSRLYCIAQALEVPTVFFFAGLDDHMKEAA